MLLGVRSAVAEKIDGKLGEIRLDSELLTIYKGKPAILYRVEAMDDKGFSHGLFPVVIFGK